MTSGEYQACRCAIAGVEAGSSLAGLRIALINECGEPADKVAGKLTVSWHRGCKTVTWKGDTIKLPSIKVGGATACACHPVGAAVCACYPAGRAVRPQPTASPPDGLQVPESVVEVATEWIRFTGEDCPATVEMGLQLQAVAAAPSNWTVSHVDQVQLPAGQQSTYAAAR